jgi:DNA polymerase-3 subunit gamma/tau
MHTLNDAIVNKDVATQLKLVDDVVASGKDLSQFVQDILRYYRNLLICKTADARALLGLPDEDVDEMERRAGQYSLTDVIRLVEQFAELARDFDSQIAQRIALESLLIRISRVSVEVSLDSVLEKLTRLGAGGVPLEAPGEAPREAPPNPERAAAEQAAAASAPTQELPRQEPPDEPAAAGDDDAPLADDAPEPVEAVPGSLDAVWARVVDAVGEIGLTTRLAVSEARPVGAEGETLVLRFDASHTRYRETLDRPEVSGAIEAALGRFTTNLTGFRTELAAPVVREKPAEPPAPAPSNGRVPPEVVEQVSRNPQVASVLEWFRGTVVDVRPVAPAAESAPTGERPEA